MEEQRQYQDLTNKSRSTLYLAPRRLTILFGFCHTTGTGFLQSCKVRLFRHMFHLVHNPPEPLALLRLQPSQRNSLHHAPQNPEARKRSDNLPSARMILAAIQILWPWVTANGTSIAAGELGAVVSSPSIFPAYLQGPPK